MVGWLEEEGTLLGLKEKEGAVLGLTVFFLAFLPVLFVVVALGLEVFFLLLTVGSFVGLIFCASNAVPVPAKVSHKVKARSAADS